MVAYEDKRRILTSLQEIVSVLKPKSGGRSARDIDPEETLEGSDLWREFRVVSASPASRFANVSLCQERQHKGQTLTHSSHTVTNGVNFVSKVPGKLAAPARKRAEVVPQGTHLGHHINSGNVLR
ncbi:MAG: hypothetical protein R3C12_19940 [Planctomycetaceae bacterium]